MQTLRVVADQNIWQVEDALRTLAPWFNLNVQILHAADMDANSVRDTDVLLVRSGVKVNAALLSHASPRFVGTATIGDDHIDLPYLKQRAIAFASAAGSSTQSVVEYVLAAMLHLQAIGDMNLLHDSIGIIGVGRIGSMLQTRLQALGSHVLLNDPPRQASESGQEPWVDLETVLAQSDILTLHTPLMRDGACPSYHLLDEYALARFQGHTIINAARGAVLDNQAALAWLDADSNHRLVLDCWESEPLISQSLLAHPQTVIVTPHIAGHSVDGKAANTHVVLDALAAFLQQSVHWDIAHMLPPAPTIIDMQANTAWEQVYAVVMQAYAIEQDSMRMKQSVLGCKPAAAKQAFADLRKSYPERRSWEYIDLQHVALSEDAKTYLAALGFHPRTDIDIGCRV